MKKTIWIPVLIGTVSAVLIVLASEAQFVISLGNNGYIGIGEIFTTLSAAVGGPISVITLLLVVYGGHILLFPHLYAEIQSVYQSIADATSHLFPLLVVAICYYKLLYPRSRKTIIFLVSWWVVVGVYYYLALLPLQVRLLNLTDPGLGATFPSFARDFFPEFIGTAVITTMIWFALPTRYRRPQWIVPTNETDQNRKILGE